MGLDGKVASCLFSWSLKCGGFSIIVRNDKNVWDFVIFIFGGWFRLRTVNKLACLLFFCVFTINFLLRKHKIIVSFKCTETLSGNGHNSLSKSFTLWKWSSFM